MPNWRLDNNILDNKVIGNGNLVELVRATSEWGGSLLNGLIKTSSTSFYLDLVVDGYATKLDPVFSVDANLVEPMWPGIWIIQSDDVANEYWFGYNCGIHNDIGLEWSGEARIDIYNSGTSDLTIHRSEIRIRVITQDPNPPEEPRPEYSVIRERPARRRR